MEWRCRCGGLFVVVRVVGRFVWTRWRMRIWLVEIEGVVRRGGRMYMVRYLKCWLVAIGVERHLVLVLFVNRPLRSGLSLEWETALE
jgi:hypothetical protein